MECSPGQQQASFGAWHELWSLQAPHCAQGDCGSGGRSQPNWHLQIGVINAGILPLIVLSQCRSRLQKMEACLFLQVLSSLGPASHCVGRPEPPGRRPYGWLRAAQGSGFCLLDLGCSPALPCHLGLEERKWEKLKSVSSMKVSGEEVGCSEGLK